MAHTNTLFTATILLITLLFLTPSTASAAAAAARPFNKIFAFGDSYTDTGNTESTTGPSGFNYVSSLPYGMTFFHRPTNRYSDGRLVIDFVARSLSLPFLPPYKNNTTTTSFDDGVNFAVAGSTAISHAFFAKYNMSLDITPESIGTQLSWFDEFLEKYHGCDKKSQCDAVFEDALVWVGEIGVNDYAYSLTSGIPSSTIQKLAIRTHSRFLENCILPILIVMVHQLAQAILSRGAKYLVIQGLPPTGCLPLALYLAMDSDRDSLGCVKSANDLIRAHNVLLQAEQQRLSKNHPNATLVYADYWDAYAAVLQSPSHYGVKEKFKACCGYGGGPYNYVPFMACGSPSASACTDPKEYINWDGVHLTEAMYEAVSDRFLHGPSCRPSFENLLAKKRQLDELRG
ncbi:hypothetical protein V2J09_015031 [Rumex salicifolius]